MKRIDISKETLIDLFINKKMSYNQMSQHLGVSKNTIMRKLKDFDIHQSKELLNEKKSLFQKKDLGLSKEELEDLYIIQNKTINELCIELNVSRSYLLRLFKSLNIKKPKNLEIENRKKTMIEKYGAPTAFQSKELRAKIENTNLERYGAKNPYASKNIREKIKKVNLEKYGVENVWSKGSPILNKIKKTNYERYGAKNPFSSDEIKDKIRQTNLEKYGVEWYCETEHAKQNNKTFKISKINKEYHDYLESLGIDTEYEYYIGNKSFDLKVINKDIVLEINPTYTHNSTFDAQLANTVLKAKEPNYHLDKLKLAIDNNLQCIHIFDWDDLDKITYLIKDKEQIYARNCEIKEISLKEANDFLNLYHLQNGVVKQEIRLGLYYRNNLVEVMTFGKPRYNKNYEYELLRLCTHKDYTITGGTQKLFKYFIEQYNPSSIISYCDKSKFTGNVYGRLGFKLSGEAKPSKHWYNIKTNQHITDNLLRQRGFDQLFGTNYGKGTSNEMLMIEHGFVEVYDCGQSTYIWN